MAKPGRRARSYSTPWIVSIADMQSAELVERTALGNGTDIKALIEAAGELLRARSNTSRGQILIPAGKWRLSGAVTPAKYAGHHIIGAGSQATQLFHEGTGGVAFAWDGANVTDGWTGGGMHGMRITQAAKDLAGGLPTCIRLDGSATTQPSSWRGSDIYINSEYITKTGNTANASGVITGLASTSDLAVGMYVVGTGIGTNAKIASINSSTQVTLDVNSTATASGVSLSFKSAWHDGFRMFGNDRTSPQGIRVASIDGLQVFDCNNLGIHISNVVDLDMTNVSTNTGTNTGNDIYITGGGAANTNSVGVCVNLLSCGGALQITNCTHVSLNCVRCTDLVRATSADFIHGAISVSGTVSGSFGTNADVTVW